MVTPLPKIQDGHAHDRYRNCTILYADKRLSDLKKGYQNVETYMMVEMACFYHCSLVIIRIDCHQKRY